MALTSVGAVRIASHRTDGGRSDLYSSTTFYYGLSMSQAELYRATLYEMFGQDRHLIPLIVPLE